jgi:hypothetical protein
MTLADRGGGTLQAPMADIVISLHRPSPCRETKQTFLGRAAKKLAPREQDWSNRVYPDEAALIQEAKRSHRSLRRAQVRSICATRWVTREDQV